MAWIVRAVDGRTTSKPYTGVYADGEDVVAWQDSLRQIYEALQVQQDLLVPPGLEPPPGWEWGDPGYVRDWIDTHGERFNEWLRTPPGVMWDAIQQWALSIKTAEVFGDAEDTGEGLFAEPGMWESFTSADVILSRIVAAAQRGADLWGNAADLSGQRNKPWAIYRTEWPAWVMPVAIGAAAYAAFTLFREGRRGG